MGIAWFAAIYPASLDDNRFVASYLMISFTTCLETRKRREKSRKGREKQKQPPDFSCESHFFTTGVMKPTKLLSFFKKKQVNEFIRVKIVIILNFRNKKVIFVVFYVKDVNKSVPWYQYLRPVFEKFHWLKKSLTKLQKWILYLNFWDTNSKVSTLVSRRDNKRFQVYAKNAPPKINKLLLHTCLKNIKIKLSDFSLTFHEDFKNFND